MKLDNIYWLGLVLQIPSAELPRLLSSTTMSDFQALADLYAATDSDALQARPDMVLGPCHFIYKSVDDLFKEGLTDPNKMQNAYDLSAKILEDTMPMRHGSSEGPISCRPALETAYMYNQYAKILFKRGDLTGAARNTKFAGGILAGSTEEIRKVAERLTLDILQDCHNRLEAIKKLGSASADDRKKLKIEYDAVEAEMDIELPIIPA